MGDTIEKLPTDKVPVTTDEKEILKWMYAEPKEYIAQKSQGLWNEFRVILIAVLLFILFSLPTQWSQNLLHRFVPFTQNNVYALIICQSIMFGLLLWLFSNLPFLYAPNKPLSS